VFSLHTHKKFFASEEHGEAEVHWPMGLAVGTLLVVTVLVALCILRPTAFNLEIATRKTNFTTRLSPEGNAVEP
jgi:hypothetical protein